MTSTTPNGRLLTGGQGWTAVTVLALALLLLVVGQVFSAEARAGSPLPADSARLQAAGITTGFDRPLPGRPAQVVAAAAPAPVAVPAAAPAPVATPAAAPAPVAAPAPAPADLCSGEGWQQRRGAAALASLRAGAERTGFSVSFGPARSGYMGLTHLQERRIELFVRGCERQSDELLRHVMAHELGHAYDTTHGDDATRAAYMAARGIPAGTNWYGCSGCTDFATPAGDFAEIYAQWARGASENRSELGGAPGPAELAALASRFFGG